jgi:hypothetical protein
MNLAVAEQNNYNYFYIFVIISMKWTPQLVPKICKELKQWLPLEAKTINLLS